MPRIILITQKNKAVVALNEALASQYKLIRVMDGEEARKLLTEKYTGLSVVLIDMDGETKGRLLFLQEIRRQKEWENLPILAFSGQENRKLELASLEAGAWDFVAGIEIPEDGHEELAEENSDAADPGISILVLKVRLRSMIRQSRKSVAERLKRMGEYNSLTGIYNKTKFLEVTREMLDKEPEENFLFVRFDIDRFQLVNSFFGNSEGDKLLRYLARQMEYLLGRLDSRTFGHIEADVFACCVSVRSEECVEMMLERAKEAIKAYHQVFRLIPVFGLYYVDDTSLPVREMLDRAALAAKSCKGSYTNTVAVYTPEMRKKLEHEQEIINDIAAALKEEQFCVYLQPKYSLDTEQPCGAEALVRWEHPKKGMLMPGDFIPVFEKNGFISRLDFYVWEKVCRLLRQWLEQGRNPHPVSVNISRYHFYNPHIVEDIWQLTNKYGIPPRLLQLEVTETICAYNPQVMQEVIQKLQKRGFSVLMDDFGAGYSSLSILKDIEVDILKIDIRFLERAREPKRGKKILASVIQMAKVLDVPVIAEGAESKEQVDFLRNNGCEYVQGYYYSMPVPVKEYESLNGWD